ncbi:redoxin domain-containing protein [uncultured Paraglaciecola sp.]|uniref:redoxin family protein n=1 Tax=uncultured Paraglaciecola sp. TaxID=1765024 RepID=UPI002635B0E8|nr:redoxin domain-containing protein [uncultured Paraglaciecola sp.]
MRLMTLTVLFFMYITSGFALADRVDNFRLLDQDHSAHELYYHKDAKAVVLMVTMNGCPIVRNLLPDLREIRAQFGDDVEFKLINSSLQDTYKSIRQEAIEFAVDFPILVDDTQLIGEALQLDRSGEVLVIDTRDWRVVYRGPVNDRVGYETQRSDAKEHYLADALAAVVAGKPVPKPKRQALGCIINFPEREQQKTHAQISYKDTIAPILKERCVACHVPNGIGPWAMTSYEMIKGFSPMIREVVRTRRMPPWEVDTSLPKIHNARGLTLQERKTLVHWIEAGSPRGDGEDPLLAVKPFDNQVWPLGEPDLIVESPAFTVPATGIVEYQFPAINNPLDRDVWVRAVSIQPGETKVVHHVLIGTSEQDIPAGNQRLDAVFNNYLMGYAPGAESYVYPQGTGVLVKAGGQIHLQMHYTAYGREVTDVSKVALYFHHEVPTYRLRQQVIVGFDLQIPPGKARHEERGYFEFDQPAIIYSLFPHAHFRGIETRFDIHLPNGTIEPLLHVPRYDFNWQHSYSLAKPLKVPAGARLVHTSVYDNSAANPSNPDSAREVPWGLQSHDEMLYGGFYFRWENGTAQNPVHDEMNFQIAQFYGALDDNFNGTLAPDEMPRSLRRAFEAGQLAAFDKNKDDALSPQEYRAFTEYRMAQSAKRPAAEEASTTSDE